MHSERNRASVPALHRSSTPRWLEPNPAPDRSWNRDQRCRKRKLPKVGHAKAQAILALRAQMKKFTRVEDLLKVKGIGRRALARLRPLVRVD